MTNRNKHLKQLGQLLDATRDVYRQSFNALVESLPENHARAYRAFDMERSLTTDYFVEWCDWSPQYASGVLKDLAEFKLLTRCRQIDETGQYFLYYRINPEERTE